MLHDAQSLGGLGDLPLAVISAGQGQPTGWAELQVDLPGLSSNNIHVVLEDATHTSLTFDEAHARQTSSLVLAVVEAAHAGRRLTDVTP